MNCIICETLLTEGQKKFCSKQCQNSFFNKIHQSGPAQMQKAIERKLQFIKQFGSACQNCGYKKNISCLCFHHKRDKLFKLDANALASRNIDSLQSEVDKCTLLCNNCHSELHYPNLNK